MPGRTASGAWSAPVALVILVVLAGCGEDKKSTPTARAPLASDLRVRVESGGVAGEPTRFSVTTAFTDPDGDVATLEVKRADNNEVSSAEITDAQGKTIGLAEGTFELTAATPGDIRMTAAVIDAKNNRSSDLPFVIGIQAAPPPPEEGSGEAALRPGRGAASLLARGARILRSR
jgi:hypothetical protein